MLYYILKQDDGGEMSDDEEIKQEDIEKFKELTKNKQENDHNGAEETASHSFFKIINICRKRHSEEKNQIRI